MSNLGRGRNSGTYSPRKNRGGRHREVYPVLRYFSTPTRVDRLCKGESWYTTCGSSVLRRRVYRIRRRSRTYPSKDGTFGRRVPVRYDNHVCGYPNSHQLSVDKWPDHSRFSYPPRTYIPHSLHSSFRGVPRPFSSLLFIRPGGTHTNGTFTIRTRTFFLWVSTFIKITTK